MSQEVRIADASELDGITTTLTAAFEHDPIWSWAFPDPDDLAVWWRFFVTSALRYPSVWVSGDYAAVAVWIPPGGTELTADDDERVEPLLARLVGSRAALVKRLLERFDESHPIGPPHYYLSLLGTHPDCRGRGLGMALLARTLVWIDAEERP